MFGDNVDFKVVKNGIVTEKFEFDTGIRNKVRSKEKADNRTVYGTVARLSDEKNPEFLVDLLSEIHRLQPNSVFWHIGGGELEQEIRRKIRQMGLEESYLMLGKRDNVADYLNAMDLFLLPSLYEGFPIVLVEAQTAGLRCLVSDTVPKEVNITGNVCFLPLELPPADWAKKAGFEPVGLEKYTEVIQEPFYGEGLDGLLRARKNDLRGIVNGIDYEEFNPETDQLIYQPYNAKTFRKEKIKNKKGLQKEFGLTEDEHKFMIGVVSRLTDQKGFDLINSVMDELCSEDVQLVVLGTGDEKYENMFRHYDWKYHDRVSAQIYYSDAVAHKIYASCDAFLMPSLFEPCGLSQLIALRYGTLPIVRETGGLKDTVEPFNEYEGTGTGFSFTNYNAHDMLNVVRYAKSVYYDRKRDWNKIIDRAMAADFSWNTSALKYQELYDWLIGY